MKIKYYLSLLILISTLFPKIDKEILTLNQEIEDIFFQTQNFEFPHDFTRINDLMGQCDHLDYLIGESELLLLKMQQAIALGDEDLIYEWNRSYEQKVEQAIKYGMQEKELYYKFLSLNILTMIDGFEYQRESIENLLEQAKRQKDHSTEAYILFSLFQNLSDDDKDKADDQLNQLFSEHDKLKRSWTYIAYMNIKGMNVLLEPDDQTDETPPIPMEIETLLYQAYQFLDKEKYNEALPILLESNDKEPNNALILNEIATTYLWLNIKSSEKEYLNQAEYYILKSIELAPDDELNHYNLACVYSQKNNIDKSLYYLEKSLGYGNTEYDWILEDLDLANLRNSININDVISKYDNPTIAYNYFTEVEKYSKKLKLNKFNILSKYSKHLAFILSYGHEQTEKDLEDIMELLGQVKAINIDIYLLEILDLGQELLELENYELAQQYLAEYIQTTEDLFDARDKYIKNIYNSSIAKNNQDQTLEEFKASELATPYKNLAEGNLALSDTTAFFKNMKQSIYYEEVLGTSDYLLIYKYTSLATEYSNIDDVENSKKYISKAERSLKRLGDIDGRMLATLLIVDYYFDFGVEKREILFRKIVRLLNDALEEAEVAENYKYQYWCLIRLASAYHTIDKNKDLQYDYFIRADSLLLEHNLETDSDYMNWRFFKVMNDYEEYDIIRRITKNNFEYYFSIEEYIKAYDWGLENYYLYVYKETFYKETFEEIDYATLIEMLKRFDEIEDKPEQWSLKLKLKRWHVEILHNESKDDYIESLKLIPQYMSMKDDFIYEDDTQTLNIDYIWIGKTILKHIFYTDNSDQFQKLLAFIEPLQWNYQEGIEGDNWFLDFIDGTYGPLNEQLYNKYIDRILSYPLSKERIREKRFHAYQLANIWGNLIESIQVYEEALLEAKQLGDSKQELIILTDLATRYGHNRQKSLSRRRFFEARQLAKSLGDDEQLKIIIANMVDTVIDESDPQYYELSSEYLKIGKNTGDILSQIQAYNSLIEYFEEIQAPDSATHYMLEGFSIKDSVITNISTLRYHWFTSTCFDYINNDMTGEIVDPITGWVFDGIKIEDPKLQQIYDEMIYLKDFDFSTLDQDDVKEYPFVYINTLDNSITLREFWDGDYLQTNEFENKIEFLLSLDKSHKEYGLLNAFWGLNTRIKDIEDRSGNDKYFGFGFEYDPDEKHNGFIITGLVLNSPAYDVLQVGDVLLCNTCNDLSKDSAHEFMSSKLYETDTFLDKPATFTVLRNGADTLSIDILPDDVQPNPYSEYPAKEVLSLMDTFFEISDELLKSAENIHSFPLFANSYREFLIAYPWRYKYTHEGKEMSSDDLIELLDRYETISTFNLVNESLNHKENLKNNPLLVSEYLKYSERINQIQHDLQNKNLSSKELSSLNTDRINAYAQLEYFENYTIEKSSQSEKEYQFSFMDNYDLFDKFDVIIRICSSDYLNSGQFLWNNKNQKATFHYSVPEEKMSVQIKHLNQTLSYTVNHESEKNSLLNVLIETVGKLNGGDNKAPIFPDNFKDKNWLIIPEGATNFLPFELLVFQYESDSISYHYLVEAVTITYAPSLSAYVEFTKRKQSGKTKNSAILISANPETESSTSYMNNLLSLRSEYGNIEHVDDEVLAINEILTKKKGFKKRFSTTVLNSKSITENKFMTSDLEKYKYIHIAAHGIHDQENMKYSGILLGRDENDREDGILQAHEIFPLNLNADLVTLSSCFSGFGEIDPNEGNLGIYRSFLIAGAKSVIISLWNVEDESTSILFSKFYEYLKEGNSKAKSLRLAKMYLKNETQFSHPFYWAPFILMGES